MEPESLYPRLAGEDSRAWQILNHTFREAHRRGQFRGTLFSKECCRGQAPLWQLRGQESRQSFYKLWYPPGIPETGPDRLQNPGGRDICRRWLARRRVSLRLDNRG